MWLSILVVTTLVGAISAFAIVRADVLDGLFGSESASGSPAFVPSPDFTLEDAANFQDFSLYWLGDEFQGLPLTSLSLIHDPGLRGSKDVTSNDIVTLGYGSCEISAGSTGCRVPLNFNIQPYCARPPEYLSDVVKTGPATDIRGALVQWRGSQLTMWTSDASIDINGASFVETQAAAESLVSLTSGGPVLATDQLGPPSVSTVSCPVLPFATGSALTE